MGYYDSGWNTFYLPLIVDCLVFIGLLTYGMYQFRLKKNVKLYLFFLCRFLGGLAIYSQIFPLDATVADRWFYFTIPGLLGLIGLLVMNLPNTVHYTKILAVCAVIIVLACSVRTIIRNANWSDNITLYSHDAEVIDNYDIESNLGSFLSNERRFKEALAHTKKSVELYPYDINLSNLGFNYEELGNYQNAEIYYKKSIYTKNISPTHQSTAQYSFLRWGGIYLFHGKPAISKTIFAQAVVMYPKNAILWAFLAISEADMNQHTQALKASKMAYELMPDSSTEKLYVQIENNKSVNFNNL